MKDKFTEDFFSYIDQHMSREEVAKEFGNSVGTLKNWASIGIPKGKRFACESLLEKLIQAKTESAEDTACKLIFEPTPAQFKSWNKLALDENKILEDFIFDLVEEKAIEAQNVSITNIQDFRFYGGMAAGQPAETQLSGETLSVASDLDPNTHVVFEVNGQSAEPQYMDGDRWIIKLSKDSHTAKKGKPAVFQDENGCYLKVYNGGNQPFASVNPDHPDVYPSESLKLVGYPVEKV